MLRSQVLLSVWMNNVEFNIEYQGDAVQVIPDEVVVGKLIQAKQGRFRLTSTGFPDFIAFKQLRKVETIIGPSKMVEPYPYVIYGIEVKSNGYLTKEEKEKCRWYLDHGTFNKILIASKGNKRGEIEYNEFK